MIRIKAWLAASLFLMTSSAWADVPSYSVVADKSFLKFFANQNNAPVEGAFKEFTVKIQFDADQLEKSAVIVEVNMASLTAAHKDVESNLKLPEWLSVAAFPKALFTSKKITRIPLSDGYYAEGDLKIRDKTVPIILNFQLSQVDGKRVIANGYATLRRKDFGVGQGEWAKDDVIKNEVRVEFRIVADKN